MQCFSSTNGEESTEVRLIFPEMLSRNKSNTNLHNPQMDDSTKGNSRDFTNSSQEGMNESNCHQKVEGVQFSSSNSGNSPADQRDQEPDYYLAKRGEVVMIDELSVPADAKQSIDTVFESTFSSNSRIFRPQDQILQQTNRPT